MPRCASLLLGALLASALPAQALPPALQELVAFEHKLLAIEHVELWDGRGGAPLADATVLIRDGRIAAVGPAGQVAIPDGAVRQDGRGHSLTPGFVMVHEHLFYPLVRGSYGAMFNSFPALYLAGGATTIRTAGSMSPFADLNLKRDIAAGLAIGPDMDVTAPYFNGPERFVSQVPRVDSDQQVERMAAYWTQEGATNYKAYMTLRRAQLGTLIRSAHARGQKVTAHLCGVTYAEAAALGIDNLEHGFFAASDFVADKKPDECPSPQRMLASLNALPLDSPAMRALQQQLIARKVALTSTLTVFETFAGGRPLAPAGALDLLTPELREGYLRGYSERANAPGNGYTALLPKAMAWEKQFFDAGGLLLAGTDPTGYGGVVPGYSNLRQVELLEEAGLSRAQALQVSTWNGARYLGREAEVGSIAAGKRADLILFKGSLAAGARAWPPIVWTMKAGVAYDRARILSATKGRVGLE
ncbi:amidohydrolase family protein [Massilia sp. TS11]|uniref:amidohydrolase family protein n=1 Tax=Massilia sp. TS11 TaxID=2908003 RepID=UPI001EDA3321|nr:amidohydrolase family protein [Massilia sp. TS11]MCG2583498.1 amidohydrolase family protein [Massilia sp. TS11]